MLPAILGFGTALVGAIFGGGNSELEAQIQQDALQFAENERQREYDLESLDKQRKLQIIAGAQQRDTLKALMIGGGVLALGAVGTAVVIKG